MLLDDGHERAAVKLQAHARGTQARRLAVAAKQRAHAVDAVGLDHNRSGDIDGEEAMVAEVAAEVMANVACRARAAAALAIDATEAAMAEEACDMRSGSSSIPEYVDLDGVHWRLSLEDAPGLSDATRDRLGLTAEGIVPGSPIMFTAELGNYLYEVKSSQTRIDPSILTSASNRDLLLSSPHIQGNEPVVHPKLGLTALRSWASGFLGHARPVCASRRASEQQRALRPTRRASSARLPTRPSATRPPRSPSLCAHPRPTPSPRGRTRRRRCSASTTPQVV